MFTYVSFRSSGGPFSAVSGTDLYKRILMFSAVFSKLYKIVSMSLQMFVSFSACVYHLLAEFNVLCISRGEDQMYFLKFQQQYYFFQTRFVITSNIA